MLSSFLFAVFADFEKALTAGKVPIESVFQLMIVTFI